MKDNLPEKLVYCYTDFSLGAPELIFDSIGIRNRMRFNFLDQNVTIARFSKRFCIGRYDILNMTNSICPFNNIVDSKNSICKSCFDYNNFNPSFYNVSEDSISKKQKIYNSEKHFVYIAYFFKGLYKVGISHHKRLTQRLCEQGARAALIVKATEDAYQARHLECFIKEKLGIPETISNSRKISLLNFSFSYASALKELEFIYQKIQSQNVTIDHFETIDLSKNYYSERVSQKSLIDISNNKPLIISGRVVSVIGRNIIFENCEHNFVVDLKKIQAHTVLLSNKIDKIEVKDFQPKLF